MKNLQFNVFNGAHSGGGSLNRALRYRGNARGNFRMMPALVAVLWWITSLGATSVSAGEITPDPVATGGLLVRNLLGRDYMFYGDEALHYAEAATAVGALRFAGATGDPAIRDELIGRYEPLMDDDSTLVSRRAHVDMSVLGIVPLQIAIQTGSERHLAQGLSFADRQWASPLENGLTAETRWWIDDLYMVGMLQIQAYRATGDSKYADRAARQLAAYLPRLQHESGLFWHSPDVPIFWGRGNGWVAVAMAEVLHSLPADHDLRPEILARYREMMNALLPYQDDNGMWRQVIDEPGFWPETSGTAMFAYAMALGVDAGLLVPASFVDPVVRAWKGLAGFIDADGNLAEVCVGTGKKNDLGYYMDRPRVVGDLHGQAPVLWLAETLLDWTDAGPRARNPIIFADVPDVSVLRRGERYYMASTTMHMSPGLPVMVSDDLVNWTMASYAYDVLVDNDAMNLSGGKRAYGRGSWAPSLRFHDGWFYASTFSATSGQTHVYRSRDPEQGDWQAFAFSPVLHDHSLWFEDDRVFMIYGSGEIRLVELEPDFSGLRRGGVNRVIIADASAVAGEDIMLKAEGSQLFKVGGRYYLFNITWPRGGMRTVIVHRADNLEGPWEGRVALQDRGVAQGGLVDAPDGHWYAMLFQDRGAVGRVPWLVPVHWDSGWPVLGEAGRAPDRLDLPADPDGLAGIVQSDDFERLAGEPALSLAWQWNHNPVADRWSVSARPGWLRLAAGTAVAGFEQARNTLTQRTFGPTSRASTVLDTRGLLDGDFAGLALLQRDFGVVGVRRHGDQFRLVVELGSDDGVREVAGLPLEQPVIHLRIDADFRDLRDRAAFAWSADGEQWHVIGEPLQMKYTLPEHFMGYRFGLFSYTTASNGGYADFDGFLVDDVISPVP